MTGLWRHLRIVLAALAAVVVVALSSHMGALAQNTVENLVQPDLVASAHMKLEADCSNCHEAFKKAAQSSLCADCHKPVKQDISAKTGFHGKNPLVGKSECANCHAEHKGRAYKQDAFSHSTFNHDLTDYKLDGKHVQTACADCHVAGKKFSAAATTCFACHDKDQPHRGALGQKCESCHTTTDWKKIAAYDHDKTKFKLRGAHAKATCFACHVGERYKDLPTACASCHGMQDVHENRFGTACESCHTDVNWKHTAFDHGKFTKFALTGAHAQAACRDCHGEKLTSSLPTGCFDCHKKQDVHKGQLGTQCADCHKTGTWRKDVTFDHDKTKFPLKGMHVAVACESCHADATYQDASTTCVSCHAKDDVHVGRFATACENCHGSVSWKVVRFDHGKDTKFALTGAHAKVGCNGCHTAKNVKSARLSMACFDCHKAQDVHRGAFGRDCAACHTTSTFKGAVIRQ
jgi:Zn finger protein HypA/HybF involved in hydrogenase expression